jgi:mono/diheme cytochrome c family protein
MDYCAVCHGPQGKGDGSLAIASDKPAANLAKDSFWHVSWGDGAEPLESAVSRVIRFGVPHTSMPGHEALTDSQIAQLTAYVLTGPAKASALAASAATAGVEG